MREMTIDVDDPKQVADVLSRFINSYTHSKKELVEACMSDHRTLLQGKMGFCFNMIVAAAKAFKANIFDGRNEYSFKMAAEIYDLMTLAENIKALRKELLPMATAFQLGEFKKKDAEKYKMAAEIYTKLTQGEDVGEDGKYHKLNMGVPLI